jgi:hypothetical protein
MILNKLTCTDIDSNQNFTMNSKKNKHNNILSMLLTDCILNIASYLYSHVDIINLYCTSKSYLDTFHSSNDVYKLIYMGILRTKIDKSPGNKKKLVQLLQQTQEKKNINLEEDVKRFVLEYTRDKYVAEILKINRMNISTIDEFWKQWNRVDQLSISLYEKFGTLSISVLRPKLLDSNSSLFIHMSNICEQQEEEENNLIFITQVFTNLISKWINLLEPMEISFYFNAILSSRNEFIIDQILTLIHSTYPKYHPSLLVFQCISNNTSFSTLKKWINIYGISELSDNNVLQIFQSGYTYENVKWLLDNMQHSKKLFKFSTFFTIATSTRLNKTPQAKIELCALFLEMCGKSLEQLQSKELPQNNHISMTLPSHFPTKLLTENLRQSQTTPSTLVFVQWLIDQNINPYPLHKNRQPVAMNAKEMLETVRKYRGGIYPRFVTPFRQ